jgi:hypothetical protein
MNQDNLIEVRDLAVEFVTGEQSTVWSTASASTSSAAKPWRWSAKAARANR